MTRYLIHRQLANHTAFNCHYSRLDTCPILLFIALVQSVLPGTDNRAFDPGIKVEIFPSPSFLIFPNWTQR